jgi:beta-lactamase class A
MAAVLVAGSLGGMLAVYTNGRGSDPDSTAQTPALAMPASASPSLPPPVIVPLGDPAPPMAPPPAEPPPEAPSTDLVASFDELEQNVAASVGLVITPVGRNAPSLRLGDWSSTGPAWSTIKVPLAIAALRNQGADGALIDAAITQSDNAAAEQLWADLGDPATAAKRVEDVLSMAGDPTAVQTERVRPGFSAFGQTQWPLVEQADFLSSAVCDTSTAPIFNLMGQIAADQRWGLGTLPGAHFKGGWGPSPDGAYLVRQIGIIVTPSGRAAVAITALPASGSFADGTSALSAVTEWLRRHVADLPGGQCA